MGVMLPVQSRTGPPIIRKDSTVVYLVSPKGEIELAPDNRLTRKQLDKIGYRGWRRAEATGTREIEMLSIRLSQQLERQRKEMTAQQFFREKEFRDRLKASARIRMAQAYSPNDMEANRLIVERQEKWERDQINLICSDFNPQNRTSGFEMETKEASMAKGKQEKRQGVSE